MCAVCCAACSTRRGYLQLLGIYTPFTARWRRAFATAAQPLLLPLFRPELFRQAALAADLDFLHGDTDWRQRPLSTAGAAYVRRLEHIAEHDPSLLIGHVYTRYLGDLSGGPILGRMAALALGLSGRQGLAFLRLSADCRLRRLQGRAPSQPGCAAAERSAGAGHRQ